MQKNLVIFLPKTKKSIANFARFLFPILDAIISTQRDIRNIFVWIPKYRDRSTRIKTNNPLFE